MPTDLTAERRHQLAYLALHYGINGNTPMAEFIRSLLRLKYADARIDPNVQREFEEDLCAACSP